MICRTCDYIIDDDNVLSVKSKTKYKYELEHYKSGFTGSIPRQRLEVNQLFYLVFEII